MPGSCVQIRVGRHAKEKNFRDWYSRLVDTCELHEPWLYNLWLDILKTPEPVTGYREVRYPKMEAAEKRVKELEAAIAAGRNDSRLRNPPRTYNLTNQVMGTFRGGN